MRESRCVRAGGALGQLLLVVTLALGVFAMHGTGHPGESAHSAMSSASATAATDPSSVSASHHGTTGSAVGRSILDHGADAPDPSSSHGPPKAMDMLSLCVAVLLGGWVLSALLASALTRCRVWSARILTRVAAARPNSPPRGPDLTRLSVLRL
ncbi:DUF6153 family protein [Streptomyces sp. NPDC057438]|uniref:DUF6153 family protein n=1 Tax=Streptomyces sp. NPDC057438 TaxID=3346133 RepID=UPI0036C3D371